MRLYGGTLTVSKPVSEIVELIFDYYPRVRKSFRNLVSIKDVPISMTQLTALNILDKHDSMSMTELANDLNMSNQQLTKVVDVLVGFDMAERCVDPNNRRKICAKVTAHGKETLNSLKKEVDRKLSFVLHKTTDEELDKLYDSIDCISTFFGFDKDKNVAD